MGQSLVTRYGSYVAPSMYKVTTRKLHIDDIVMPFFVTNLVKRKRSNT